MAMSFNFVLTGNSKGSFATSTEKESSQTSNNESANQPTLITSTDANCVDGFAGKDLMGSFDESKLTPEMMSNMSVAYNGAETAGSIAYNGIETAGSIAYGGAETAGSIAYGGAETAGSVACGDGGGGDFGGGDGGFSSFG